jgi:hypothetical protein
MYKNISSFIVLMLAAFIVLPGCKKEEYSFGSFKTPVNLTLTAAIAGVDAANPNGNGSGNVLISTASDGEISYRIDYGDGITEMVPAGVVTHKYANPGINDYTITVNAIGTGGVTSTISKTITVFVDFKIPADMLAAITNGSSRIWVTDRTAVGHFGVGPVDAFFPIWYEAGPDTREACAYDDEITFSKDALDKVSMTINNKGASFSIGAATGVYGFSGGDGCYAVNTGGTRLLTFSAATSASTAAQSTRIQFKVPGNGIINFGTGGVVYEILSFTSTTMNLRNIGADGNSWYQKLKVKP